MNSAEILRDIELGKLALAVIPEPARSLLLLGANIAENVVSTASTGTEVETMSALAMRVTQSWQDDLDAGKG